MEKDRPQPLIVDVSDFFTRNLTQNNNSQTWVGISAPFGLQTRDFAREHPNRTVCCSPAAIIIKVVKPRLQKEKFDTCYAD